MASSYSEAAYRIASASGATHIGLLLLVYDALATDLRKASEALAKGDIGERCRHSSHALLLLGHLEEWCALLDDVPLATSLRVFYGHTRAQLVQYQGNGTPQDFSALAKSVTETRATWQLKEQRLLQEQHYQPQVEGSTTSTALAGAEHSNLRWSA